MYSLCSVYIAFELINIYKIATPTNWLQLYFYLKLITEIFNQKKQHKTKTKKKKDNK